MDRDTARETAKGYLESYLQSQGINTRRPFNCLNPEHNDTHPSMSFDRKRNKCHCFSCGASYDIFDLIGIDYGLNDYNDQFKKACELYGIEVDPYKPTAADDFRPQSKTAAAVFADDIKKNQQQERAEAPQSDFNSKGDKLTAETNKTPQNGPQGQQEPLEPQAPADYTEYYRECRARINDPAAVSYLTGRGISVATAAAYWIGYDPQADPAGNPGGTGETRHPCPRIIIPTTKGHYVGRSIDPNTAGAFKKMNNKGGKPGIFNQRALYAQDVQEVFIVEGAFDALSIIEAGAAAVALNSTSNADALIKGLEEKPTAATLILCCDNDDAGRKANDILRQGLQRLNISHITGNICGGYKDPNEYLQADRKGFTEAIEAAERQAAAKPDNVSDYIAQLMGTDIERFKDDIKTGFPNLDANAGGLYTGLYTVAAISSLGKTTFCAQLADQLAAAGHDVIFFSLEQSRLEMVSKSIARITAQKDAENAVTSLQIRKGEGGQIARDAAKEYIKRVGDRLSVVEGNFNCNISFIGDYIRQYIRRNNTRPVIFIDYLQILQPEQIGNRQQTTKEMVDSTVTELKRLSREMNLTIFIISSVNRANYLTPIDFESLKESGGIEFTSDVIWGLQLQCLNEPLFTEANKIKEKRDRVKQAKAEEPRKIELCCLKNRYGIANFSCYFDYFPANDLFRANDAAAVSSDVQEPQKRANKTFRI